jgi:hypothetical protein
MRHAVAQAIGDTHQPAGCRKRKGVKSALDPWSGFLYVLKHVQTTSHTISKRLVPCNEPRTAW